MASRIREYSKNKANSDLNSKEEKAKEINSLEFIRQMDTAYASGYISPQLQNEILKNINGSPVKYSREEIKRMTSDPVRYEKELKYLSEFLFNYVHQFKRLAMYYARMLTYDWYIEPTNADEDDITTAKFKKSKKKALDWIDGLDLKLNFPDIVESLLLEDTKFYYLRESENGNQLQELPSDYCLLYAKNELGYQFYFDMTYFITYPSALDNYAPEFREYYDMFINSKDYKGNDGKFRNRAWSYWVLLDSEKAWVFKFHGRTATTSPPLSGLIGDALDIVEYKQLLKTKSTLDVWKILLAKIPMNNKGSSGNKINDLAIDADMAGKFEARMQAGIIDGAKVMVTPFDTEVVSFEQTAAQNSIVGLGNSNFRQSSGMAPVLSGDSQQNSASTSASLKVEESFVDHVYRQFERFINFRLKKTTGSFRFKIHLEGTRFDKAERISQADSLLALGGNLTPSIVARGITLSEFENIQAMENGMGIKNKMIVLQTSYTKSDSSDSSGAPVKQDSELTDEGMNTRDKK